MRKFLIFSLLVILLLISVVFSTQVALATTHPLRPGHSFFSMQNFAELTRAQIILGDEQQTAYYLELAMLRTDDLVVLAESDYANLAADYLDQALDRAISSIGEVNQEEAAVLEDDLKTLLLKISMLLSGMPDSPATKEKAIEQLQAKVLTLEQLFSDALGGEHVEALAGADKLIQASRQQKENDANRDTTEVPPLSVLFPPGSPGAEHEFFPLEGEHGDLECLECHVDGEYAGTPDQCVDCHLDQEPENHYVQDCAGCHSAISWQEVNFDHGLVDVGDCLSCHMEEAPEGHFTLGCSACHTTDNWGLVDFDHQAFDSQDCRICHLNETPQNHYQAQCSACHNTSNWSQADFNHQAVGATDCQGCHSARKPANHYGGQCSACHNTSNWSQANFNHQAVGATDCKACHSGRKPANHYGGQCSACHNTSNWSQVNFNHGAAGATDCKACHSGRKPANHFGGQCSACHGTSSWSGANFNHGAAGATDCKACHSGRKPANHFDGQCSQCHTTSSWGGASFKHSFPMNHGNANGKCSQCHPSGGAAYSCFSCHDKAKINNEHSEEGISNIGARCLDCHPKGREGDGDEDD